jgi:SAM-dependent methyltransferase
MPKDDLIERYYRARGAKIAWPEEVARRAEGATVSVTSDYFFHMNPLYEPNLAMQYIVGRYEAVYDALRRLRPKTVLEIGCAQGLSTWLMTSYAEHVTGVDNREVRISVARQVFPEVEWHTADYRDLLNPAHGRKYDVIVNSHGPFFTAPEVTNACRHYIYVGYRARKWKDTFTGGHKIAGRQLSFSTTLQGEGAVGREPGYWRYYVRRNYAKEARFAVFNGFALPL